MVGWPTVENTSIRAGLVRNTAVVCCLTNADEYCNSLKLRNGVLWSYVLCMCITQVCLFFSPECVDVLAG
ncbi:hypothetical protein WN943_010182 [Citrus x changshan-huyou]